MNHTTKIITLVGAGGKTTICTTLAKELTLLNKRVLFTTTTKIYNPHTSNLYIGSAKELKNSFNYMIAAKKIIANDKLKGYDKTEIEIIKNKNLFDYIIVEGDGAKRKSIKAPNSTEPVYPLESDLIIGVIGLDSLNTKISEENVFRKDLFNTITDSHDGDIITLSHIEKLINHREGLFRNSDEICNKIVFLNKYDKINNKQRICIESDFPLYFTSIHNNWFENLYEEGYFKDE